jgi:hypothetical protein
MSSTNGLPNWGKDDFERVGAHEAGHTTVGLSLGAKLLHIEYLTSGLPDSLQAHSFDAAVATRFTPSSFSKLDPRLQYLQVAGGMAGETFVSGKYFPEGAADDLFHLKSVKLSDAQISVLVEIAVTIVKGNLVFFERLRKTIANRLESPTPVLLDGAPVNGRFKKTGVEVDVWPDILKLLPD